MLNSCQKLLKAQWPHSWVFKRDELDAKIAETEGVVLANDNNPGQVVISGTPEAVEAVLESVKSKRAVKLNVSGAFHSPLDG